MENFLISVRCVTPVLLTICLGILIRAKKIVPEEVFGHLSILCFRFLIPCQLFYHISTAQLEGIFPLRLLAYLEAGVVTWFLLNYVLFFRIEADPRVRGAYIQNSFRSNIAVVGVSLAQTVIGPAGVAAMSIAIAVLVPTYNILAVVTLETCRGGKADLKDTCKTILRNPLIRACMLGIVFLLLGLRLPQPVEQAVQNIGSAGSVMTLIALGASLCLNGIHKNLRKIIFCNLYRLLVAPLVLAGGACLLGFRDDMLGVILLCAGSPMAATSYSMALACGSDQELTAQIVATTSLLFCLTIIFWVFMLPVLSQLLR